MARRNPKLRVTTKPEIPSLQYDLIRDKITLCRSEMSEVVTFREPPRSLILASYTVARRNPKPRVTLKLEIPSLQCDLVRGEIILCRSEMSEGSWISNPKLRVTTKLGIPSLQYDLVRDESILCRSEMSEGNFISKPKPRVTTKLEIPSLPYDLIRDEIILCRSEML